MPRFYSCFYEVWRRSKLKVLKLHKEGVTQNEIARRIGVHPATVRKTLNYPADVWEYLNKKRDYLLLRNRKFWPKGKNEEVIYSIVCPITRKVVYVGRTGRLSNRIADHVCASNKSEVQKWAFKILEK